MASVTEKAGKPKETVILLCQFGFGLWYLCIVGVLRQVVFLPHLSIIVCCFSLLLPYQFFLPLQYQLPLTDDQRELWLLTMGGENLG